MKDIDQNLKTLGLRDAAGRSRNGFSVLELLIVGVMFAVVTAFALIKIVNAQKDITRNHAAQEVANYLERARNDSMRRHAANFAQMAQVTILNDKFYSVTLDANGDGLLDTPIVLSVAERNLSFTGPFPRTFAFDSHGRAFDPQKNKAGTQVITVTNESGASEIEVPEAGRASVSTKEEN
jgi:type II secretory pathway pseudopilin PulG